MKKDTLFEILMHKLGIKKFSVIESLIYMVNHKLV